MWQLMAADMSDTASRVISAKRYGLIDLMRFPNYTEPVGNGASAFAPTHAVIFTSEWTSLPHTSHPKDFVRANNSSRGAWLTLSIIRRISSGFAECAARGRQIAVTPCARLPSCETRYGKRP